MSWYRPQEWISVPDRLFFRSHRDGAAAPVPGCLCGVGKGTSPAPPRASPTPPCAAPAPPCALPHPHTSHSLCTFPCTAPRPPRRPALPSPPFPAPVPTPFPRHLPPLPANLPKPSDPCHIFFSFFYIFCHNFGDSAPEIPKSASFFVCLCSLTKISAKTRRFFRASRFIFFFTFPVCMLYY